MTYTPRNPADATELGKGAGRAIAARLSSKAAAKAAAREEAAPVPSERATYDAIAARAADAWSRYAEWKANSYGERTRETRELAGAEYGSLASARDALRNAAECAAYAEGLERTNARYARQALSNPAAVACLNCGGATERNASGDRVCVNTACFAFGS